MTDWFPTFCELLELAKPENQPQDGVSFAAALRGMPAARDQVAFHFPHGANAGTALREGNWKLIRRYAADGKPGLGHELYDLAADLGESIDVAGQHPEKVAALSRHLDEYLKTTAAIVPAPNPAFVLGKAATR